MLSLIIGTSMILQNSKQKLQKTDTISIKFIIYKLMFIYRLTIIKSNAYQNHNQTLHKKEHIEQIILKLFLNFKQFSKDMI